METTAKERFGAIRRVLWIVLLLNLAVAGAKLAIGHWAGSLAMVADGFHSLMDGSSNVIGLVGIALAARPPDHDHPYGHQKYEPFFALAIAALLGVTALEVVQAGIARLTDDSRPEPSLLALAVMVATMAVNLLVTLYEAREGRRHGSEILQADSAHTRSDIFVSFSVLAGLGAVWIEWYWVDIAVAFVIAALILFISYGILKRVSAALTDTTALTAGEIEAVVRRVEGVISTSNIRSRGSFPNLFIDLEIQVDPDLPIWRAHQIAHAVHDRCVEELQAADAVVHVEPAVPPAQQRRPDPTRRPTARARSK